MHFVTGKIIVIFHFQAEVPPAEVEGGIKFHAEVIENDEL